MVEVFIINYRSETDVLRQVRLLDNLGVVTRIWDNDSASNDWGDLNVYGCGTNIGFGAAVNALAKYCESDWFIVLNPDIEIAAYEFSAIIDEVICQEESIAFSSPVLIDKTGQPHTLGYFPSYLSPFLHIISKPRRLNKNIYITGALMALRLSYFEQVGGFDERYFLYYEEVDLQKRFINIGVKRSILSFNVVHDHGRSSNSFLQRLIISDKSLRTYYKKHLLFPRIAMFLAKIQRLNYLLRGILSFTDYFKYLIAV